MAHPYTRGIAAFLLLFAATASFAQAPMQAQAQVADPPLPAQKPDYLLPLYEIIGFDLLVNRINYCCGTDRIDYAVTLDSINHNLHSSWTVDRDPFSVNQLGHPYQGSMYYGFARSAGFNFWESAGYAVAGSALWEIAGERTPPSRNDMVSTGIGGTFLGESLFRMASLVLEKGGGMNPFWRETVAAVVSPSTAFNRYLQGHRPETVFSSRGAEYYSRLQLGLMGTVQNAQGNSAANVRNEAQADFALDYGMPGKDGYQYRRPFDYFAFQATATTANFVESLMTRGLLAGRDYKNGPNYRGIWGIYGSYDYISPQTFRISSTALSLGTTGQWRHDDVVVQGTAMAGLGYAAVGTINSAAPSVDRDYHYGVAPQALLAARAIFRDRSSLDLTLREYFVSDVGNRGGHDNIARADIAYTWRVKDQHAITVKYLWNRRDANYPDIGNRGQSRGTFGIFYTLLGHDHFGAVDWK
ncbi:MAG: hypothetical protein JWQ76_3270 [Ramlibacter sp.]|nr:hypothetical protein [Ramlibacter sp.]